MQEKLQFEDGFTLGASKIDSTSLSHHPIMTLLYENRKFHRLWSWRDETVLSSHKGLWKFLHQVAVFLASPPKQKASMIKEPSLLLGWMLSGGGPLVQDTKPVLCDDPPNGMSLLSLLVTADLDAEVLTLTFQGMSSRLAESLKTLKMFLSHHEDGNPYWNQIYWKYLTLGRLIIHGNWWKGTGTFELARKEHLTLKPLLLYSSQARQSSLVDANSTMIFEIIPCGISHSHAFIVPISLL